MAENFINNSWNKWETYSSQMGEWSVEQGMPIDGGQQPL